MTTFRLGNIARIIYRSPSAFRNPDRWYGMIGKIVETKLGYNHVPELYWLDVPNEGTMLTCWNVKNLEFVAESEEELIAMKLGEDYL